MIRSIVTYREALSVISTEIAIPFNQDTTDMIRDLVETAHYHTKNSSNGCAGLAAIQIGYNLRAFVIILNDEAILFINPEIIKKGNSFKSLKEGCLSRPGVLVKKHRSKYIKVKYVNWDGEDIKLKLSHFEARVFQHELDHLNGILI